MEVEVEVEAEMDNAALPSARLSATFLESNAQSHRDLMFAWGDIIDNAREAQATKVHIDARVHVDETSQRSVTILSVVDNGCGMNERVMQDGVLSLAFTKKDATATGQHYGMGSTAAIPRIAEHALFLSRANGQRRTAGLLSKSLSQHLGSRELKVPQCSWDDDGQLFEGSTTDEPLSAQQRLASEEAILKHTPFSTVAALLSAFDVLGAGSGTLLLLWDVHPDFVVSKTDIKLKDEEDNEESRRWEHEVSCCFTPCAPLTPAPRCPHALPYQESMRAFLGYLYYVDKDQPPWGELWLMGAPIKPHNWTSYLRQPKCWTFAPECAA